MATYTSKRTKQGSSTLTERRNTRTGKSSTTRSQTVGGVRTSRNLGTGKVRKTKLW